MDAHRPPETVVNKCGEFGLGSVNHDVHVSLNNCTDMLQSIGDSPVCAATKFVMNNVCTDCPSGYTCDGTVKTQCATTQFVMNNVCTDCPPACTNDWGGLPWAPPPVDPWREPTGPMDPWDPGAHETLGPCSSYFCNRCPYAGYCAESCTGCDDGCSNLLDSQYGVGECDFLISVGVLDCASDFSHHCDRSCAYC